MRRCQALVRLAGSALGPESGGSGGKHAAAGAASLARLSSTATDCQPPAFVFDIDGVLIQGRRTLPAAKRALAKLYSPDGSQPLYPLAFLTNGGGVTECFKAHQLSEWLGVNVQQSQVVLSHTPMRQLAAMYADQPVLVAGRGQVQDVMHRYGFRHVLNLRQLARAMPAAVPFHEDQGLVSGRTDLPCYTKTLKYGSPEHPISAVMVLTDPSDWYRDLQLITDVLLSRGMPGHTSPPDAPPVAVYFSNPDLLWANEFSAPRFGQGAFAACLETLYEKVSGQPLNAHFFGKPHAAPYRLAEELLLAQAAALGLVPPTAEAALPGLDSGAELAAQTSTAALDGIPWPFGAIYAVGDNPAADVRGANAAGSPWVSVLVTKTGVARQNCAVDCAQASCKVRAAM
ncbi:hypothetical protein D9Q98_004626 [Chlorella vulgaris]|uniref:Uncharacterized protein n=1 Tax=Chlorella vulgaris TaxID=3077 RepID=A0A9D4TQE0_CHLVU|nr:hypothetical protein D9Q98_004626 [Chlorella vulgaris]